jgi:hypothetical protein
MEMHSGETAQILSDAFDIEAQRKHDFGTQKYRAVRFLEVDSLAMAMEEVIDLSNYSRFAWIKLAMLQQWTMQFEMEFGTFLRFKEEFKLFMQDKGIDIDEAPEQVEAPNGTANVAVDNGVPYVEGAQQDGFFSPFRKQS